MTAFKVNENTEIHRDPCFTLTLVNSNGDIVRQHHGLYLKDKPTDPLLPGTGRYFHLTERDIRPLLKKAKRPHNYRYPKPFPTCAGPKTRANLAAKLEKDPDVLISEVDV